MAHLARSRVRLLTSPAPWSREFLTSTPTTTTRSSSWYTFTFLFKTTVVVISGTAAYLYISDSRAGIHRWGIPPLVHSLTRNDPELAHRIAIQSLKWSGQSHFVKDVVPDGKELEIEVWGHTMSNPIGMAAGFDKHGEAIDGLLDIGFGYVEIGSITPLPQPGNPQPRMFRLPSTESLVNRYGFNSEGHYPVLGRLRSRIRSFVHHHALSLPTSIFLKSSQAEASPGSAVDPVNALLASPPGHGAAITDGIGLSRSLRSGQLLGINLGKNKTSDPDSVQDFVEGVRVLGPFADVLVVNISSPNTPGLRGLQRRSMLDELVGEVIQARDALAGPYKPPLLIKIAPDLTPNELRDVGEVAKSRGIAGIIVSNTTTQRPDGAATEAALHEAGGLSGPPLKPLSLNALATLYAVTDGSIPLIGCGGIRNGSDALDYARAGATLVQLYTALGYQGVGLPRQIKDDVSRILKSEGRTWQQVVGSRALKLDQITGLTSRGEEVETEWQRAIDEVKREIGDVDHRIKQVRNAMTGSTSPFVHEGSVPLQAADVATPHHATTLTPSTAETVKGSVPHATVAADEAPTSGYTASHATPVALVAPPARRPPSSDAERHSPQHPYGLLTAWKERRDTSGPRKV